MSEGGLLAKMIRAAKDSWSGHLETGIYFFLWINHWEALSFSIYFEIQHEVVHWLQKNALWTVRERILSLRKESVAMKANNLE